MHDKIKTPWRKCVINSTHETYEGNEPYVFVSYSHKDSDRVQPLIQELKERGFRIWYDAEIEAGSEWPEYIARRLLNCI